MIYVCVTEIDADTNVVCTQEPMRTGPTLPNLSGWQYQWADQSNWPVACVNGIYQTAPKYYGTCNDDADLSAVGVLATYTAEEYQALKSAEHQARKPYPSWIGDLETMTWAPPTPRPTDHGFYYWDEASSSWISKTRVEHIP